VNATGVRPLRADSGLLWGHYHHHRRRPPITEGLDSQPYHRNDLYEQRSHTTICTSPPCPRSGCWHGWAARTRSLRTPRSPWWTATPAGRTPVWGLLRV